MSTNLLFVLHVGIIFHQFIIFANSNDITCSADGLCRGKPIICNENEDCSITCDGKDSCWYSIIQCPIRNKCNVWCGLERNTCDAITINASHSTALYMYCADNECDDATIYCPTKHYIGVDHQCTLEGAKTLDRVLFYTIEGFNDINIANIPLAASMIVCGDKGQYRCAINAQETGCVFSNDKTCETYRLPTSDPSVLPTITPSVSPTSSPTIITNINPTTDTSSDAPTIAPVQTFDTHQSGLEFYIYYNDPNGVNMILAKWMQEELLNTYDEHTGTSHDYNAEEYDENRKWRMGGIVNMTFCAVFNTYYRANGNSKACQRFKDYEFNSNDLSQFNTQYVAYGTFGILAAQSIETFQLFVIDSMTSILFRQTFNANMAQRLKSVGFDYIFQAVAIKVQPLTQTRTSITNVSHVDHDNSINIALGVLLGILAALTFIVVVYCTHYYALRSIKKSAKPAIKSRKTKEGRAPATIHQHTAATEQMNLKIVPRHSTTATGISIYDHGLLPTKRHSTTSTGTHFTHCKSSRLDHMMEDDQDPYQKDDKCIAPGYYLAELQKTYLSTDETASEEDQNDVKLPRIPTSSPPSDISYDKSIISSIISFGKRNKKHKKRIKHKRSQTVEMHKLQHVHKKRKKHKRKKAPKRKRSLHWGFTDGGDDIRYARGENGLNDLRVSRCMSIDTSSTHSWNPRHTKCQSAYNGQQLQFRGDALPDIKALELARKSSYNVVNNPHAFPVAYQHSYVHQLRSPQVMNQQHLRLPPAVLQRTFSLNTGLQTTYSDHRLNDEQFLEQLSPSMKSIEEMYASPKSTDGPSNWTAGRQSTASVTTTNLRLQSTASPPANNSKSQTLNLEAQHKINEITHRIEQDNNVNHVMNDSQSVIMNTNDNQCV